MLRLKPQDEGTDVSALGRIVETVTASLITYVAVSVIGNGVFAEEALQSFEGVLAQAATTWTRPLLIAAVVSVVLAVGAFVASSFVPIRGGVGSGLDPLEPTLLLGSLARFCLGAAVVCGLVSAALYLVQEGKVWGMAILAAAAVMVARWAWVTGQRRRQFWTQGII
jgi:hypothetical protein